ncbi:MAG: sugar ABC transporter ATP-binding protein, partial [Phycisphaerales bacterium]|nr:sugar ABC transporter ATP-binding protein [Phycisphaerales bacterium]
MSDPLLEVRSVSKSFPGVKALKDVSLEVREGEVLAVIGENGAGKSTLMKILAGVQQQDEGDLRLRGRTVTLPNVASALREGIVLIHQELNLAENLDVGANIALGREPRRFGFMRRRAIDADARRVLKMLDLDMHPRDSLEEMSIGRRQMV